MDIDELARHCAFDSGRAAQKRRLLEILKVESHCTRVWKPSVPDGAAEHALGAQPCTSSIGHGGSQMPHESAAPETTGSNAVAPRLAELALVIEYRKLRRASVDDFHTFLLSLGTNQHGAYWALVACLLSVQVRDAVALRSIRLLMDTAPSGPDDVGRMSLDELEAATRSCNFCKTKAANVQRVTAEVLRLGSVPTGYEQLLRLPGVGPKIANLMCSVAFGNDVGIVVDTHVKRVAALLGWVGPADARRGAEATRRALQLWVPRQHWGEFSLAVIGLGQQAQRGGRRWVAQFLGDVERMWGSDSPEVCIAQRVASRLCPQPPDQRREGGKDAADDDEFVSGPP